MNVSDEGMSDLVRKVRNAAAAWQNEQIVGGFDADLLARPPVVVWRGNEVLVTVLRAGYEEALTPGPSPAGEGSEEPGYVDSTIPHPSPYSRGDDEGEILPVDEASDDLYFDEWHEVTPTDDEVDSPSSESGKSGKRRK